MSTLNSKILSVTRRTKKGYTVGEIFDRLVNQYDNVYGRHPYNSVRARVYELARTGSLLSVGERKDSETGRTAKVFVRN